MKSKDYCLAFMNWATFYESKGNVAYVSNNESFSVKRPCFHKTYPWSTMMPVKQEIDIAIKKGTRHLSYYNNHYCPFSYDRIVEHIGYLKELFGFDFDFSVENKKYQYVIHIKFEGFGIYFRVLVTWIRYLYEFPANMAMLDVYRIKDMPEFKDINIFSLSTLVLDSLYIKRYFDDHLCDNRHVSKLQTIEELRNNLNELTTKCGRTMQMFKDATLFATEAAFTVNQAALGKKMAENNIKIYYDCAPRQLYDWMNEELFKQRVELYKNNLKVLKNER